MHTCTISFNGNTTRTATASDILFRHYRHGFPCGRPLSKQGAAKNGQLMSVGCGSLPAEMWRSEGDLLRSGEKRPQKNISKKNVYVMHLSDPTVLLDMLGGSITFIRGTLCVLTHVLRMLRIKHSQTTVIDQTPDLTGSRELNSHNKHL